MNATPSRRHILVAAFCIVPLAGCSVLRDPPAAQIYRISPMADYPKDGQIIHKRLVVDIPTAPQSLDTDRIALIRDRTRFDYYADSVWTDRVPMLLEALLVEAFENEGSIPAVGRGAETLTPDYLLKTEIREFEARYDQDNQPPSAVVSHADHGIDASSTLQRRQRRGGVRRRRRQDPGQEHCLDDAADATCRSSTRPERPLAYRFTRQVNASYST